MQARPALGIDAILEPVGKRAIGYGERSAVAALLTLATITLGVGAFNACSLNPQPAPPAHEEAAGPGAAEGASSGGLQGGSTGDSQPEATVDANGGGVADGVDENSDGLLDGGVDDDGTTTAGQPPVQEPSGASEGAGGASSRSGTGGAAGAAGAEQDSADLI